MTQAFNPDREFQPLDEVLDHTPSVESILDGMGIAPQQGDSFAPADAVALELYRMFDRGGASREVLEWLNDLTMRLPGSTAPMTIEAQALSYAKFTARQGTGLCIRNAVARGKELSEKQKKGM